MKPYGNDDRELMWKILGVWAKSTRARSSTIERDVRTEFPPLMHSMFDQHVRRMQHPVYLHDKGWLIGEELHRHQGVIPVVTFQALGTQQDVKEACFQVGLMSLLDGKLRAEGWRFEQAEPPNAEGKIGAHPYAHAQAIIGWNRVVDCLIHRPHADGENCDGIHKVGHPAVDQERIRAQQQTLDIHPAFPLGVKSLSGLAATVFATLYGAPKAKSTFGAIRGITASAGIVREDFVRLGVLPA